LEAFKLVLKKRMRNLKDFDFTQQYNLGKANIMANALCSGSVSLLSALRLVTKSFRRCLEIEIWKSSLNLTLEAMNCQI